jgi:HlyD family secretion protein
VTVIAAFHGATAMQPASLYRKAALEKLASPERLDVLMQVTSPRGWLALYTMGGVLFALLVWSVFGSIPTRVDGEGILIRGGVLREIRATAPGDLVALGVRINDVVKQDQVVGQLRQSDYSDEIRATESKKRELSQEAGAGEGEDRETISGLHANIQSAQAEIGSYEQELSKAREDLKLKRQSLAKGLITRQRVMTAERDVVNLAGRVESLRANIRSLYANMRGIEQRIRSRYQAAENVQIELDRLKTEATLRSPTVGRVIEIKKRIGDSVSSGEVIAVIEPEAAEMEPVVYVNSSTGKQIKPGMEAQVSPSTVKREDYGYMKATIDYVGEYPVTPQAVQSSVANQALANELIGASAKIEVRAKLTRNGQTTSGYAWSSSGGPSFRIQSGTRVMVSVVVDRRRPITLVLPIIRRTLGAA